MNDEEIMKTAYGNLKSEYDIKNLLWDKELRRDIKNAIYKAIEITRQDERKKILDWIYDREDELDKDFAREDVAIIIVEELKNILKRGERGGEMR